MVEISITLSHFLLKDTGFFDAYAFMLIVHENVEEYVTVG